MPAPFLTALQAQLQAAGCRLMPGKAIPHGEQWLISSDTDQVTLNYWPSRGTVQLQGKPSALRDRLEALLRELRAAPAAAAPARATARAGLELGIDESGKGDWYGPLVIAAAALQPDQATQLQRSGVRDSKLLTREELAAAAAAIQRLLPQSQYRVLVLAPAEYNRRYERAQNINLLLAEAYAELAAPLVNELRPARVICDQFSQRADRLQRAFQQRGLAAPQQMHHAEADSTAVAAASVLASHTFQRELARLGAAAGLPGALPAGASAIRELRAAAQRIIARDGTAAMAGYAKLNFKPVRELLGLPLAEA